MTFDEYQNLALRTAGKHDNLNDALTNWAFGITGEAGEVVDAIKKIIFHGHYPGATKLKDELGDLLWYITVTADSCGYTLEELAVSNNIKLKMRYPVKFTSECSRDRDKEV